MNENLQNVLANALQKAMEVAEQTGKFVLDIAPELVHQFLMWELASSIYWLVIGLILMCVFSFSKRFVHFVSNHPESLEGKLTWRWCFEDDAEFSSGVFVFSSIVFLIGGVVALLQIHKILYILIAPEIYLIKAFF